MIRMRWTVLFEKYRTITNYLGTALVAWLLSAMAGEFISLLLPDAPLTSSTFAQSIPASTPLFENGSENQMLAYYMPICERNIFDSLKRSPCTEDLPEEIIQAEQKVDLNSPPVKSDIAATLIGTMVSTIPRFSVATLSPKGKKEPENYRLGDKLLEEAEIYDIQRNKIFFYRNGRREFLEVENLPSIYTTSPGKPAVPGTRGVQKLEDGKLIVTREKVESTLGDLNKIIQQARMVPNYQNGKVNGFKIFAIRSGSVFQELGLKNGDVIHRINGTEIDSVEKAIPMLQLAKTENSIALDLTRRGKKKTISIEIQ